MSFFTTQSFTKFLTKSLVQQTPSDLYQNMKNKFKQFEDTHEITKTQQQRQFLKIYMKILEKMSLQLMEAKQKYNNLNKQQLKDQKCLKLATEINFFRDQCNYLKIQLNRQKQILKKQKIKQDILIREKQALKSGIFRRTSQSIKQKVKFKQVKIAHDSVLQQFQSIKQSFEKDNQSKKWFSKSFKETQLPNDRKSLSRTTRPYLNYLKRPKTMDKMTDKLPSK